MISARSPLFFDPNYFASMYNGDNDPWEFETSWYERRKFALTVAALPELRYRSALEPGCSNGALTELLAQRCDHLTAFEFIPDVVERAADRFSDRPGVTVVEAEFPMFWPDGTGNLVVWSEVAYYLTETGADRAAAGLRQWLEPGGDLVAVHFTGETNYPRPGSAIGPWLDSLDFLERLTDHVDPEFDLGVWRRRSHSSTLV